MNYPPNAPPPGGYGGPPGGGGYGGPPGGGGGGYGGPPGGGGYGGPPGGGGYGGPPGGGGYGPPPPGGFGPPPGGFGGPPGAPMAHYAPFGIDPVTGAPFSDKSRMVAGLLQIFVGCFGVGRFYTGHTGIAVAQIFVSWLTCGAGVLWPLIDGIMMLSGKVTDSQGRPLRE